MTPLATARHRDATARGERPQEQPSRSTRYYAERAALASMLKDYGVLTLLWLLPVYVVLGVARMLYLVLSRRFEDAFDLLAAWGWNLLHLPGTLRRRIRAQSVRSVADRKIRPFMASTFRLPRWFERAEEFLDEGLEEFDDEELGRPLPRRAASVAAGHPVLLGSILAIGLGALAVRHFVGPEVLSGGALAAFPADLGDFFREFGSGVRTTVLGGVQPGSPALAGLGAGSWVAFGSTALAQKVLLGAMPALAGIAMYRAMARQTGSPASAVVAATAYVLSATMLWSFSEGRLSLLVVLAVLPLAWDRIDAAFARRAPEHPFRFGVGLGVALSIGAAFAPAIVLPVALFALVNLVAGRRRDRGSALVALAALAAAALAFPVVIAASGDPASAPHLRDRDDGPVVPAPARARDGAGHLGRGGVPADRGHRVLRRRGRSAARPRVASADRGGLGDAPGVGVGGRAAAGGAQQRADVDRGGRGRRERAPRVRALDVRQGAGAAGVRRPAARGGGPGGRAVRRHRRAGAPGHVRRVGGAARWACRPPGR